MHPEPEVKATQERMVFSVASESSKFKRYRVDLLANGGAAACSCTDHGTRRQPFIDRGGDGFSVLGSCKHVRKARAHFLKALLIDMAKSEEARS